MLHNPFTKNREAFLQDHRYLSSVVNGIPEQNEALLYSPDLLILDSNFLERGMIIEFN